MSFVSEPERVHADTPSRSRACYGGKYTRPIRGLWEMDDEFNPGAHLKEFEECVKKYTVEGETTADQAKAYCGGDENGFADLKVKRGPFSSKDYKNIQTTVEHLNRVLVRRQQLDLSREERRFADTLERLTGEQADLHRFKLDIAKLNLEMTTQAQSASVEAAAAGTPFIGRAINYWKRGGNAETAVKKATEEVKAAEAKTNAQILSLWNSNANVTPELFVKMNAEAANKKVWPKATRGGAVMDRWWFTHDGGKKAIELKPPQQQKIDAVRNRINQMTNGTEEYIKILSLTKGERKGEFVEGYNIEQRTKRQPWTYTKRRVKK